MFDGGLSWWPAVVPAVLLQLLSWLCRRLGRSLSIPWPLQLLLSCVWMCCPAAVDEARGVIRSNPAQGFQHPYPPTKVGFIPDKVPRATNTCSCYQGLATNRCLLGTGSEILGGSCLASTSCCPLAITSCCPRRGSAALTAAALLRLC